MLENECNQVKKNVASHILSLDDKLKLKLILNVNFECTVQYGKIFMLELYILR